MTHAEYEHQRACSRLQAAGRYWTEVVCDGSATESERAAAHASVRAAALAEETAHAALLASMAPTKEGA